MGGGLLTLHSVTKIPTGTHISGRVNSTKARVPLMAGWTSKKFKFVPCNNIIWMKTWETGDRVS